MALRNASGKTALELAAASATRGRFKDFTTSPPTEGFMDSDEEFAAKVQGKLAVAQLLRELTMLCTARQRLALATGLTDEGNPLLGVVPLDLMFRVCEEAQAASALLGRSELRMWTVAALPEPEPEAKTRAETETVAAEFHHLKLRLEHVCAGDVIRQPRFVYMHFLGLS